MGPVYRVHINIIKLWPVKGKGGGCKGDAFSRQVVKGRWVEARVTHLADRLVRKGWGWGGGRVL